MGESSVVLAWSSVSNDVPCGSTSTLYKVQWRRRDSASTNVEHVTGFRKIISGLRRTVVYLFSVQSTTNKRDNSPWVAFSLPPDTNYSYTSTTEETHVIQSNMSLAVPLQIEADILSPYSVNLTWFAEEDDDIYYIVCFVELVKHIDCKNGNFFTR